MHLMSFVRNTSVVRCCHHVANSDYSSRWAHWIQCFSKFTGNWLCEVFILNMNWDASRSTWKWFSDILAARFWENWHYFVIWHKPLCRHGWWKTTTMCVLSIAKRDKYPGCSASTATRHTMSCHDFLCFRQRKSYSYHMKREEMVISSTYVKVLLLASNQHI